jgi:hypothetical protein
MHQSFLSHRRGLWGWVALTLAVVSAVTYYAHEPIGPRSGGSWVGYTLGTIGALLIVWLMWFGVRKRSYTLPGNVRGWLSAHVYLGTALILVALFHAGFQIGWNIHTLALALMLMVIFSGFFGVWAYLRYPSLMTSNRSSTTRAEMLDGIREIDRQALSIATALDPGVHAMLLRSIERTPLGGGVWAQLTASDATEEVLEKLRTAFTGPKETAGSKPNGTTDPGMSGQTIVRIVEFASRNEDQAQAENLRKLIDLLSRKRALAGQLTRDMQLQALMEIWLYIHVPLSFALLAALIGHIVAVFFYW